MSADGTIVIDTRVDQTGIRAGQSQINRSVQSIGSSVKKLGGIIAAAFAVTKIVGFGKECIELGSDLAEVQNVVDVTFSTMSDKVNEFAQGAATAFGLSETMAKRYVGTFGAMAKSFGFTEEQAYNMSTALTGLAGDVASFYNISQEAAYTKLKSVFTGETESLKELGVVLTQTALDEYALANGFGKTTSAMTEQEKVALRMSFVQKQLSAASGDFIRTSDSWANQIRIMQLQIQSLKATIGQGLINIFTPVIKVINLVLQRLATVANAFKAFTELITRKKSSNASTISDTASATEDLGSAYDDASGGASDLADSTGDVADAAKSAAKEAKKALSPLDELHRLDAEDTSSSGGSSPSGGSGGSGGGISGDAVDFGELAEGETVVDEMSEAMQKLIEAFQHLKDLFKEGFFEGLGDYKSILEGIKQSCEGIKDSLIEIATDPAVQQAAWRMAENFAKALGQITGSVARIGLNIGSAVIGGIDKYLQRSKNFIKKRLVGIFDARGTAAEITGNFAVALADISDVLSSDAVQSIYGSIVGVFTDAFFTVTELGSKFGRDLVDLAFTPIINNVDGIKEAFMNTVTALEPIFATVHTSVQELLENFVTIYDTKVSPIIAEMRDTFSTVFNNLLEGYNTYVAPVLDELSEKFVSVWENNIMPALVNAQSLIGQVMDIIMSIWQNALSPLMTWISENIMPVLAPIFGTIVGEIIRIFGVVGIVFDGIVENFSGFLTIFQGMIEGDFSMVVEGFGKTLKAFRDMFVRIFNYIKEEVLTKFSSWFENTFGVKWENVFAKIGEKVEAFRDKVEDIWTFIKEDLFGGVIDFLNNTFVTGWETAWTNVQTIFGNIWDGLVELAKSPLNAVIGLANTAIGYINSALSTISSAFNFSVTVPTPFGSKTVGYHGFSLGQIGTIPYLATGAVIPPNQQFLAMLGDQTSGNNLEAPEGLIRQIVREESSGGRYEVPINLNGYEILRAIIEEGKLTQMQNGSNPFELG